MNETPVAIDVTHLSKTFGNLYALRQVDLKIAAGEFLALFGPNGAGKTTLIRILSTLAKASSGDVIISGFALGKEPDAIRRQIGVIAHQTFLYEDLTAVENLRFYGKLYDVESLDATIDSILSEVGLQRRKHDRVRTYSRGMQQRLAIARAMLHDPPILFLDEPYTGLDQHAAALLSEWLRRLRSAQRTILMVTHNIEKGLELCDRVAILLNGRIRFDKPRDQIDAAAFNAIYSDIVEQDGKERR